MLRIQRNEFAEMKHMWIFTRDFFTVRDEIITSDFVVRLIIDVHAVV